jgi:hypothetical protein
VCLCWLVATVQMLYESVIEVDERLHIVSDKEERLDSDIKGVSGDYIRVARPIDVDALKQQLQVRHPQLYFFDTAVKLTALA